MSGKPYPPDKWLAGRSREYIKQGDQPRLAAYKAILDWNKQLEMEEKYNQLMKENNGQRTTQN